MSVVDFAKLLARHVEVNGGGYRIAKKCITRGLGMERLSDKGVADLKKALKAEGYVLLEVNGGAEFIVTAQKKIDVLKDLSQEIMHSAARPDDRHSPVRVTPDDLASNEDDSHGPT